MDFSRIIFITIVNLIVCFFNCYNIYISDNEVSRLIIMIATLILVFLWGVASGVYLLKEVLK